MQLFGPISSCFLPEKKTISILEKYPKILTSVKGTTHKPGCGVKVIPSQCNGSQQFSNMVVLCFLGIFSNSFCGNQVKCFFILSDVVLSACALGSTLYTPAKKTKVRLFLGKAFFKQHNHLSSSVPQLHSHVNILKRRCAVSHLIALSENVSLSLV